jgi:hypothetical protein
VTARPETQSAPGAVWLRTRECHSALNAMRPSAKERKRNFIYPRYSGFRYRPSLILHGFRAPSPTLVGKKARA